MMCKWKVNSKAALITYAFTPEISVVSIFITVYVLYLPLHSCLLIGIAFQYHVGRQVQRLRYILQVGLSTDIIERKLIRNQQKKVAKVKTWSSLITI